MGVDPRSIDFEGKLPTRFKLSYGLVSLADGMMVTAFVQFLMIYLTDTVRVSPGAVGIALMVARLWDAVTDPVMGAISDRTRSRYGRRRPWLLWGCAPLALTWIAVWSVPANQGLVTALYVLVSILLFQTARTVVMVPYLSLSAELSTDYHERSSIQAYRSSLFICGNMIGATFITLAHMFQNVRQGFFIVAVITGVATIVPYLLTFRGTCENPAPQHRDQPSFMGSFSDVFRNKPYLILCLYFFLVTVAFTFSGSFFVYVITYWLNKPKLWVTALLITTQLSGLVCLPVWVAISRRVGKKTGNVIAIATGGILQASAFLLVQRDMPWLAFLWAGSMGLLNASTQIFPFSLAADTVDMDELNTGHRKEGVYFGLITFLFKSASAIGVVMVGFILQFSRYVPLQQQTAEVILRFRLFHAILPGVGLLIAVWLFATKFPITVERANEISRELKARREKRRTAGA